MALCYERRQHHRKRINVTTSGGLGLLLNTADGAAASTGSSGPGNNYTPEFDCQQRTARCQWTICLRRRKQHIDYSTVTS